MILYYISTEPTLLNNKVILKLLKDQLWSKDIPIEYIDRFIKHSLCFGAYIKDSKEQVGFARVITDYTSYAYICDFIVDKTHRGNGIGKELLDAIMNHPELRGLKTWSLRATDDSRHLYEARGFKPAAAPNTILEIEDLSIYSKEDFINLHKYI